MLARNVRGMTARVLVRLRRDLLPFEARRRAAGRKIIMGRASLVWTRKNDMQHSQFARRSNGCQHIYAVPTASCMSSKDGTAAVIDSNSDTHRFEELAPPGAPPPPAFQSDRIRRWIVLSYWVVLLLGIPFWWYTTSIERLALPRGRIHNLARLGRNVSK